MILRKSQSQIGPELGVSDYSLIQWKKAYWAGQKSARIRVFLCQCLRRSDYANHRVFALFTND